MKKYFLLCFCFLFVSCGGYVGHHGGGGAQSCHFRVDRGFIVRWSELPIPIYIHASVSDISRKNFVYSLDIWNEAWNYHTGGRGRLFELIGEVQQEYNPADQSDSGDGVNILFLDNEHEFLTPEKQGVTHVRNYWGGAIYDGDIIINDIHYDLFYERSSVDYSEYTSVPALSTARSLASSTPDSFWKKFVYVFKSFLNFFSSFWKKKPARIPTAKKSRISAKQVDFISLSIHELGHLAGMEHITSAESIMNPMLERGKIRRNIKDLELSSLACGYELEKNTM